MRSHLPTLWLTSVLSAIAAPALAQPYRTTQIPCPTPVAPEEIDGKTTVCGVLTVPENYNKPQGRQIEISYAILKSKSLSPQPDPVIALHGGPGGSDMSSISAYTNVYATLRQTRDVILFDQRGSRFSGDLMCAPAFVAIETLSKDPKSDWTKKFEQYASNLARTLKVNQGNLSEIVPIVASYKVCGEIFQRHGFDLNQYNTSTNARDVVNLGASLGYQKVNLYGISYGTFLAMRVMRDYPDLVRSVILDSTIPPQVTKYEAVVGDFETPLLNLIEDCRRDAACDRAYPNLKSRTITLINNLAKKPIPLEGDKSVGVAEITGLLEKINVDLNSRKAAYIPLIISELERGITTTYQGVVSETIFPTPSIKPFPIGGAPELLAKAEELRGQARKLLNEAAKVAEAQRPSQQWVKQVLQAIETLPEADRPSARANLYGVGFESQKPRDRQTLIAAVDEIFPVSQRQALKQPLQAMSAAEVRHTYEVISGIVRTIEKEVSSSNGAFRTIDCQDFAPATDFKKVEAAVQRMQIPPLATRANAGEQSSWLCQVLPVKPAPIVNRQTLRSDIPTLVLQGRYDTQTNSRVGSRAVEGLSKGILLEFPNAGHGVLIFSQCARDVGASFVSDPSRAPNAECRTSLEPRFVLPPTP